MTITTFEFTHCSRWNLFKMFLVAFFQRKISLAWDPTAALAEEEKNAQAITGRTNHLVPNESAKPKTMNQVAA